MKILFYSYKAFEGPYLEAANRQHYETSATGEALSLKTAGKARGYDAVCVFTGDDVSAPVILELKKNGVRFVAVRATAYDNVDINMARQSGIRVAFTPDYSTYSVAEHTIGMILALNRRLIQANKQVHNQDFTIENLVGFDLNGKIAGIIGTGKIGSVVAKILYGFGCRILAHDINPREELETRYGVSYTSLDHLCNSSDIITLHLPLNEATYHVVNKQLLSAMKDGVLLINTARGALIRTADLITFLENGHIGYFGMDVYENDRELFFYDHTGERIVDPLLKKLLAMPNVLITPHQGFATAESLANAARITYHNIDCWVSGRECENELPAREVAPAVYEEEEEL